MPRSKTRGKRGRASRKSAFQPYTKKKRTAKRKLYYRKAKGKRVMIKRLTSRRKGALKDARWKKKVNKVAKRVLTSMNDDKACMYRQYVDPAAEITDPAGVSHRLDDTGANIVPGAYVENRDPVMRAILRREHQGFWQIPAFRGMVAPSWGGGSLGPGDNNLHQDTGQTLANTSGALDNNRIDIRAFKQVEIPFLPCIPKNAGIWHGDSKELKVWSELERFCRTGDKIKITNNYMRLRFFATKNGQIQNFVTGVHEGQVNPGLISSTAAGKQMMCGFNSNIKVVRTCGGPGLHLGDPYGTELHHPKLTATNMVNNIPVTTTVPSTMALATSVNVEKKLLANKPISYEITARRYARVRIIVWERECYKDKQVELSDFMRYNDKTEWKNEFHYGSEELHQSKRFYSKLKTKRDLPFFQDTAELEQLAKGKFIVDKIVNLPMGKEKTVILNPLKGKVLSYDPSVRNRQVNDTGSSVVNNPTGDHDESTGIPFSTNHINLTDDDSNSKIEYVPINKQYGMFMLFDVQRAGIEYDIFQKFEYDK